MARSSDKPSRPRVRALPWVTLLQAGVLVGNRMTRLSARERSRLVRLLRDSRGWPGRLTSKERAELRKLIGKLDPAAMGRELAPLVRGAGRGRKRR